MKIIYLKLSLVLFCITSVSTSYGAAIACYDKVTNEFCGFPPCSESCEPGFPKKEKQLDPKINQDWLGIFRNFSNAKYDERGRFIGSEKKLAQEFSCKFQTRDELKQYLDENPEERGQGRFGFYKVLWQAVISVEGKANVGHQSLSYGALENIFEGHSKVSHNSCWVTNDPFFLLPDSEEELSSEVLICQTVKENILVRISKTNETNLFRRVYLNKQDGQVFPSTKQWLKKCQN